jgi:hypothetical protein
VIRDSRAGALYLTGHRNKDQYKPRTIREKPARFHRGSQLQAAGRKTSSDVVDTSFVRKRHRAIITCVSWPFDAQYISNSNGK